jgi:hypothetical protein
MAIDINKIEEQYVSYITFMKDNLNDLEEALKLRYGKEYELSYEEDSIDEIELFLSEQLQEYTITTFPKGKLLENVSTYMGELVRRKMNGHWALEREEDVLTFGYPYITNLDGLPKEGGWVPLQNVFIYRDNPERGYLGLSIRSILYANAPSKW